MRTKLKISSIVIDEGLQVRTELNADAVNDYAEAMERGEPFDPVVVFDIGRDNILAHGFHRVAAAKKISRATIDADVRSGTRGDALKFSLGANIKNGVRLKHSDKRRAIELALVEWPNLSDRGIAEICGTGHPLVAEVRKNHQLEESSSCAKSEDNVQNAQPQKRIGLDGKKRSVPPPPLPQKKKEIPPPPMLPPKPSEEDRRPRCKTGAPIPKETIELWNRATLEIRALLKHLSAIWEVAEKNQVDKDMVFAGTDIQQIYGDVRATYANLETALPYAVCPTCAGKQVENCTHCKHRGYLDKSAWHRVPAEIKKMREGEYGKYVK